MVLECTTFRAVNTAINDNEDELKQIFTAGSLSLICTLRFDRDEISDTYNHWICSLEVVSDTENIPERSLTLYPNTLHFEGDALYTVSVTSKLESIGHDDLQNVFITIGVPANEQNAG